MAIYQHLKEEADLRLKQESLARIFQCLDLLTQDQVWFRPNNNVNSVGNLVLHLSGNIRQYCCHGIGGQDDTRDRNSEFVPLQTIAKKALKTLISLTMNEALDSIHNQADHSWLSTINIQCFEMTKLSALIHVIEHTSYHVGQITQMTKWLVDVDTGYYSDLKLD